MLKFPIYGNSSKKMFQTTNQKTVYSLVYVHPIDQFDIELCIMYQYHPGDLRGHQHGITMFWVKDEAIFRLVWFPYPQDPCMVNMLTFEYIYILMVNVTIYSIHGSYGLWFSRWVFLGTMANRSRFRNGTGTTLGLPGPSRQVAACS